jgi:hypothetical protein
MVGDKGIVVFAYRDRALVRPAFLVVVLSEPELVSATSHIVNKDVSRAAQAIVVVPDDSVLRISEDFIGACVEIA